MKFMYSSIENYETYVPKDILNFDFIQKSVLINAQCTSFFLLFVSYILCIFNVLNYYILAFSKH